MGRLKRVFGRDDGETPEQFVRRLAAGTYRGGYAAPVVPSVVELYDRIGALEARIASLERRDATADDA